MSRRKNCFHKKKKKSSIEQIWLQWLHIAFPIDKKWNGTSWLSLCQTCTMLAIINLDSFIQCFCCLPWFSLLAEAISMQARDFGVRVCLVPSGGDAWLNWWLQSAAIKSLLSLHGLLTTQRERDLNFGSKHTHTHNMYTRSRITYWLFWWING